MKNFSRPPFFPMMIDLNNKEVLIVVGGNIASIRAETLSRCGAKITEVSLNYNKDFPEVYKKIIRAFIIDDIQEKFFFVIAATNDRKINKIIYETAKSKKIPVNVCDNQSDCDFFFPSLINVENVAVSVCTAGLNSSLTRKLSDKLREVWASWIAEND
ncbi:MAG: bifunctional precorrin-2 dehydrogenase/sirohydrochlorin ferrochelatase [Synergistaceae bacterium]|nr:bifunctional precorrin-2 dehydrogenase/sirohydrochlorin ferrochelatase [Synergistaceae bacterium]